MDDEVGVAADGRGEVGVAAQVQAEMAQILCSVDRLCLRTQHDLVDEGGVLALGHLGEDAVEHVRPERPGLGHLDADRGEHLPERPHLLQRRLVVDPVD